MIHHVPSAWPPGPWKMSGIILIIFFIGGLFTNILQLALYIGFCMASCLYINQSVNQSLLECTVHNMVLCSTAHNILRKRRDKDD